MTAGSGTARDYYGTVTRALGVEAVKAGKAGAYRIIAAQYDFRTGGPQFSLSVEELKSP